MSKNYELLSRVAGRGQVLLEQNNAASLNPRRMGSCFPTNAEIVRLASSIYFSPRPVPAALAVIGVHKGCGATWISARLAQNLAARTTRSVCILDCNGEDPAVQRYPGNVEQYAPWEEGPLYSEDPRQIAQLILGDNLWLVGWRSASIGKRQSMLSEECRTMINVLRRKFDYVIADGAPITQDESIGSLGPQLDGAILVVEACVTRRSAVLKARETLDAACTPLLGTILNKKTSPLPPFISAWL